MKTISLLFLVFFASAAHAAWKTEISKDKMSDQKFFFMSASSTNKVWNGKKAELTVSFKCGTKDYSLRLWHPWVIDDTTMTIRFDKKEAKDVDAMAGDDHRYFAIGAQGDQINPADQIEEMKTAKTMLIRYTDAAKEIFTAEFSTADFAKQMERADKLCK